jgi:HK97 gp10 family phage protein
MAVQSKNDLPRISSQIERALSAAVKKAAFSIEAHAKELAPVDTGNLRNSIQTDIEGPLKATVGTNVEYAQYQEFGTRYQKGTPFLSTAADQVEKEFASDLSNIERSLR